MAKIKHELFQRLRLRIEAEEITHPDGRVVVFTIPSRPRGVPLALNGRYVERSGESLVGMTQDRLKQIFAEAEPDFTAQICPGANLDDLEPAAIQEFRHRWLRKSGNEALRSLSDERLLSDAELLYPEGLTYAALILFGKRRSLGRFLAQAEVVFEYRSNEVPGPANQRVEYRQGYFLHVDELWRNINLRNDMQHFRDGFFVLDVPTFNETACREAMLNAVSHRDYQHPGSIFIRQYPRRLEVDSPGGLPTDITPQNIIYRQLPRNRRLAETFARCGLVERAGQGADLMFGLCVKESKPLPDFSRTDEYGVVLTLHCEIQDADFLRFLEKIGQERLATFTIQDLLLLDLVNHEKKLSTELKPRVPFLLEQGIIEKAGGGRYLLARQFYDFIGQKGAYTRKRGLDHETNKALLYKHIADNDAGGSEFKDLVQVLPAFSRRQLQHLLQEMKNEGCITLSGKTKGGRWHLATNQPESSQ